MGALRERRCYRWRVTPRPGTRPDSAYDDAGNTVIAAATQIDGTGLWTQHFLKCETKQVQGRLQVERASWDETIFEPGDQWNKFANGWIRGSREPAASMPLQLPQKAVDLEPADIARVCRAAIAMMNGHPPSIVRMDKRAGDLVQVSYDRPSDGKTWTNQCRIEGDRVIWRTVDAFGPGSGLGRWRVDPADEIIRFKLEGAQVEISEAYSDGSSSSETYTVK